MNAWLIAVGFLAAGAAVGHAVPGAKMFYSPIIGRLDDAKLRAVFTAIWQIVTIHFALNGVALVVSGFVGGGAMIASLVVLQFTGYAIVYLILYCALAAG
jgi:hypothetical protein